MNFASDLPLVGKGEAESLFLSLLLLKRYPYLKEVVSDIESRLQSHGAMGTNIGWNGEIRHVASADFERKFPGLQDNQLLVLLEELSQTRSDKSGVLKGILRMQNGVFRKEVPEQRALFKQLSSSYSDLLEKFRNWKISRSHLLTRKYLLSTNLDMTLPGDITTIDLTDMNTSNNAQSSSSGAAQIQLTLQNIARGKLVHQIDAELASADIAMQVIATEDLPLVANQLKNGGFLGCKIQEGMVFNMPQYLLGRKAGLFHSATSKLGTTLQIATHDIHTKVHLNYRKQYTISGHMMNPAYCSVFDQTGNFLLTGADDYLVKIWDVNKGILVKSCKGHIAYVSLIVVSADNSLFASSCTSGSIRIWRMKDGICLHVLLHKATVNWMKFDTATSALASGSDDGQCMIWDLSRILAPNAVESPLLNEIVKDRKHKWETSHGADYSALDADDILSMEIHHRCGAMRGLFEWSRPVEQSPVENNNVLVLTQIRDPQNYTPQSEPLRILCLDVSSLGGVVITGCEDGVARIWRFDTADNTPENQYPNRIFRRQNENRKGMLSSNQYAMLERIEKHLLLRLEGHVAPITDVQFNSLGDRVVTGSAQDGSVRIWSLSRKYNDSVHLILDLAEEDDVAQPIVPSRSRRQAPGLRPKLNKVRVHNVCWTADDLRVVTIQSVAGSESSNRHELNKSTRLKVWDSMTGDLLRIIWSVSENASKCLIRHPFDSHIVVTAGEDGFVSVWNIELESNICKLAVLNDDSTPANLVDLSITHDGRRIAATDVVGRLTVFALDNPEKFYNFMYHEQYFSTDYTDILLDVNGYAIDSGTQVPVDQSPVGLLCRIDGSAYDIQPPVLSGPDSTTKEEAQAVLKKLFEDRFAQPVEMDRVYDIFVKNKRTNRLATRYRSSRIKNTSHGNSNHNRGNGYHQSNQRESRVNYIDFDINQYVPSSDESNDSEFEGMEVANDDEQQVSMNRHFYRLRRSSASAQRGNGGVGNNMRSSRRRDTTAAATATDAFDEDGDERNPVRIHNGTTRAERAALRAQRWGESSRGRAYHLNDDDDEISIDFLDEEEDDQRIGLAMYKRGGQRRRSKRTAATSRSSRSRSSAAISLIDSDNDYDGEQQLHLESTSISRAPSERRQQRRNGPTWRQDSKGNRSVPIGIDIDRKWLQLDMQFDMTYVPQVGDSVIYLPQGHQEYLQQYPENTPPPWVHFSTKWPFVACEVRDMKYVLPLERDYNKCKSILVVMTLALVGVPIANVVRSSSYTATFVEPRTSRHSTHHQEQLFTVTIRNSSCADFLVPKVLFDRAITLQYTPGMKVLVYYRDDLDAFSEFPGSIVNLSNKCSDWPHSPWEVVTLVWEADEGNAGISPLFEENGLDVSKQPVARVSLWEINPERTTSSTIISRFYDSKLPTLNPEDSQRMANEIETLVESDARYSIFQFEPDPEMYDDYGCYIPVPITTDLIVRRLRNLYYRQKAQLDHDVDQLVDNCCLYNKPNADISQDAKELRELIRRIVYPDSFPLDATAVAAVDEIIIADDVDDDDFNLGFSFEVNNKSKRARATTAQLNKTAFDDSDSQDELPRSKRRHLLQLQQTSEPPLSFKFGNTRNSNRRSAKDESSDEEGDEEEEEEPPRRSSRRAAKAKDESSDDSEEEEDDDEDDEEDSPPAKSRTTRRSSSTGNGSDLKIVLIRPTRSSSQQVNSSTSGKLSRRSSFRGRNLPKDEEEEDNDEDNDEGEEDEEQRHRPRRRFSQRAAVTGPQLKPRSTQETRPRRQSSRSINYAAYEQDSDVMDESEGGAEINNSSRGLSLRLRRSTRSKAVEESESAESSEPEPVVKTRASRSSRPVTQSANATRSEKGSSNPFDDDDDNGAAVNPDYFKESPPTVIASLRSRQQHHQAAMNQQQAATSSNSRPMRRVVHEIVDDAVLPTRSTRSGLQLEADQSSNGNRRSMGTRRVASNFNATAQEHERQHQQQMQSSATPSPSRRMTAEERRLVSSLLDFAARIDQQRRIFAEPAPPTLECYDEIVTNPSDLSTIRGALLANAIGSVSDVIGDILRMYDNCELYHDPGSKEVREAKSQRRQFLNHLKQMGLTAPTPEGLK